MSPDPTGSATRTPQPAPPRQPGLAARVARGAAWILGSLLLLVLVAILAFSWYSTTADFQHRVGKEVVSVLEDATGGRVELAGLRFNLWHLAIEADGLVIHGLEGPGEAPYLSADKIQIRVKILSFFQHTTGTGAASHIGLSLLRIEHPQVHLIIDKDGKTNQPVPKHPSTSTEPIQDTLLDLRVNDLELVNGIALLNDRAVPFDAAASNLNASVRYLSGVDHYSIKIDLTDLRTRMKTQPEAHSSLHVEGELGRDMAELKRFEFDSGAASVLKATASISHFAKPEWQTRVDGTLDLRQISILGAVEGLNAGALDLEVDGHSCEVSPVVAQQHPRFWQKRKPATPAKPNTVPLAPDPDCKAGYLLVGKARLRNAGFQNQYVRLHDINGGAQLHITPSELLFTALSGSLPGGGSADGELRIVNWLGETAPAAPAKSATAVGAVATANKTAASVGAAPTATPTLPQVATAHAYLVATVNSIPLRTIMDISATKGFGDLGFDTSISGPVKVEWGGPAADIADTVVVDGDLKLRPTGVPARKARVNIPVSGEALAHYDGRRQVVNIERVALNTPQSSTLASGVLGVNRGDPLTNLRVNTSIRDLGEFDQLLQTLGFEANGKKGSAAIPVVLHGAVGFQGTATGRLANLDVKGHLQASQVEVKLGTELDTQIDSVVADAEYSTESGLAVASSTIRRGSAVLNVAGAAKPHKITPSHGAPRFLWDNAASVDASVQLANADVADVLQIAGQQGKFPITGTIGADAKVNGTFGNLTGQGRLALNKGVAYGEPYDSATMNLAVRGQDVEATDVALVLHGDKIAGNGGYNLTTKQLHGHIQADNLQLSKFQTVAKAIPNDDAKLSFVADANGTVEQPGLKATLRLAGVSVDGKAIGEVAADIHSEGSLLRYTTQSTLIGARLDLSGQTELTGDYQTHATLNLSGFDVAKAVETFSPGSIKASSSIAGTITVSGPAKTPQALSGSAEFPNLNIKLQGVELNSVGPIRLSLRNGVASLDAVHITGLDTDLQASGTAQVFGATGANGGKLDIRSSGTISMAIAHTLDPDLLSSGKVEFQVAAGGAVKKPALTGSVRFDNVNLAMNGIPNGLTGLNGTLVFNEDRLNVQSLTATTGGGKLNIGGFLTYNNGLYADLTATGDTVRVRLYGLSATANANLRLQGGPQSLLLSGNVLITRFGVGPNVDFAAFSSAGGVSAPPDPASASSKLQLNVHVTSSPQLDFQNSYAQLAGTVDITIRGTVAEPTVLGRIQITDGNATFAGTKYELQRGDIYFSNPVRIDPTIDLDATARVETYDITVGLHGTASNLKPTYRSEPPLTQADIFNLLALGRTQEEAQLYSEHQVQQGTDPTTSALLGGALNATVSNRVGKLFGGGSVKIDPAFVGTLGNSSARITVQQQLSRQLSVTYATNVNSTAQQLLQGTYNVTPDASLVVTRDETGVFSVVYKIRRRYR
ncbi:MAG: translocation/assembly module TamB [Acidobacteriota bacterium]|nr:translocation/assembly module TamB [Acidobacteriota bacterium]